MSSKYFGAIKALIIFIIQSIFAPILSTFTFVFIALESSASPEQFILSSVLKPFSDLTAILSA